MIKEFCDCCHQELKNNNQIRIREMMMASPLLNDSRIKTRQNIIFCCKECALKFFVYLDYRDFYD